MNIFITGTNTDIGKTYITTQLFNLLQNAGKSVVIFKPFQTEEIGLGCYPDLEVYKMYAALDMKRHRFIHSEILYLHTLPSS